jgi:hypothetical protein
MEEKAYEEAINIISTREQLQEFYKNYFYNIPENHLNVFGQLAKLLTSFEGEVDTAKLYEIIEESPDCSKLNKTCKSSNSFRNFLRNICAAVFNNVKQDRLFLMYFNNFLNLLNLELRTYGKTIEFNKGTYFIKSID